MRILLLLLLMFILASCSYGPIKSPTEVAAPVAVEVMKPEPGPVKPLEVKVETPAPKPVQTPAAWITKVTIKSLTGFSKEQDLRFRLIAAKVQDTINSKEFKDRVLNFSYNGKKAFVDNNGKTNEQVLQKILSQDWVLEYRLEYIAKKPFVPLTVGYTYPNVSWIVINSKIFDSYTDADIADNIVHEYGGHKLGGFDHAQSYDPSRDYSVPYGLGYLVEELLDKKK